MGMSAHPMTIGRRKDFDYVPLQAITKPYSHPTYEQLNAPNNTIEIRPRSAMASIPTENISEHSKQQVPTKLYSKIKRCLHCQFPIYCPSVDTEPGFCSKDCCTCYNWFRAADLMQARQGPVSGASISNQHRTINNGSRQLSNHGDERELDDVDSFSYHPTWIQADSE